MITLTRRTSQYCNICLNFHWVFQFRGKQRNRFIGDNDIVLNNVDAVYQGKLAFWMRTVFKL